MKKLVMGMLAGAGLFFAAGCEREVEEPVVGEETFEEEGIGGGGLVEEEQGVFEEQQLDRLEDDQGVFQEPEVGE